MFVAYLKLINANSFDDLSDNTCIEGSIVYRGSCWCGDVEKCCMFS
jgi:hypothetical protein